MENSIAQSSIPGNSGRKTVFLVFHAMLFLYLWLWVDPSLLYYGAGPLKFPGFSVSLTALADYLAYPGGPVTCLSALLSQAYYYPWAGALILTALAAAFGLGTECLTASVAGGRVPVIWAIPALILVVLCNGYVHQLPSLVAGLAALLAAGLYARAVHGAVGCRFRVFSLLLPPLYYVAGGAAIVFAVLCGLLDFRNRKPVFPLLLAYLSLTGAFQHVVGAGCLSLNFQDTHVRLLPYHVNTDPVGENAVLGLYLFWGVVGFGSAMWRRRRDRVGVVPTPAGETGATGGSPGDARADVSPPLPPDASPVPADGSLTRLRGLLARPAVELEIAFVLAAIVVWASFDGYRRTLWQVNKYASWEMWPEVLQEAAGLRRGSYSFGALHVVTRALYETGQLPSQMFSYPQHRGGFALAWGLAAPRAITVVRRVQPMEVKRAVITDVQSDDWYNKRMHHFFTLGNLNLKLGLVNEAEHEAHEALELFGDHPQVLKQLAMLNIVKGQTEAARAFLQALRPYIHHGEWAAETLSRLETDPLLLGDKHVQEVRSVMLEQRSLALGPSLDERFDALLQKNRRNRMAFEYRMAFYLLHLLLDEFAREFGRLDDFGYPAIPRHYEEAILIYESISGQKVDLHGRQISEGTRQAYEQFCKALDFFHRLGDRQGAQATLERGFGRTYFYYYFLGES